MLRVTSALALLLRAKPGALPLVPGGGSVASSSFLATGDPDWDDVPVEAMRANGARGLTGGGAYHVKKLLKNKSQKNEN
jgi:hypothetical protein